MFNVVYTDGDIKPSVDDISEAIKAFKHEKMPFDFWLTSKEESQISDVLEPLLFQYFLDCYRKSRILYVSG